MTHSITSLSVHQQNDSLYPDDSPSARVSVVAQHSVSHSASKTTSIILLWKKFLSALQSLWQRPHVAMFFESSTLMLKQDYDKAMNFVRQAEQDLLPHFTINISEQTEKRHALQQLMLAPDSRQCLFDLCEKETPVSLSLENVGTYYSCVIVEYDQTLTAFFIKQSLIPEVPDHSRLLRAFQQGSGDQIEKIMEQEDHIPLLSAYFEGMQDVSLEANAFSQKVIALVTQKDLETIIDLYGQIKDPLNEDFGAALLAYALSTPLSKTQQALNLLAICFSIPSSSTLWRQETAAIIKRDLHMCASACLMTDSLAGKLYRALLSGQDEGISRETLNIYRLRFAKLISFLGDDAHVLDPQISHLLFNLDGATLSVLGPFFFLSTYLRDKLLQVSKDPSFTQGKEAVLATLWKHLLSLQTIEEEFIGIFPMPEEVENFPDWKKVHRSEIVQIIKSLTPQKSERDDRSL